MCNFVSTAAAGLTSALAPASGSARETKTFATEAEAKQYAKEMLSESNMIYAGTLIGADQRVRRMISGKELHRWIWETEK